jgi:bacteriocin biosynthesis cyclodehydratase domain-containing protein
MAEPPVVNPAVLAVAFDPWARSVARMLLQAARGAAVEFDGKPDKLDRLLAGATAPSVAVLIGSAQPQLGDVRRALEHRRVPHLTVEPDAVAVWVGPAVVPERPGCDQCWMARQRQHADALRAMFAHDTGTNVPQADQILLGARAGLAVAWHVLRSPDDEAGVVRRFTTAGAAPTGGRVRAVSGCPRCDRMAARTAGWSLHGRGRIDVLPASIRRQAQHLSDGLALPQDSHRPAKA